MSLDVLHTKWKCLLKGNRVLRLSISVENIFYIFLEQMNEQDLLKRRTLMWTSEGEWEFDGVNAWNQCIVAQDDFAKKRFDELKESL
jgi:hypothetical protein